jgi:hypothetical protein
MMLVFSVFEENNGIICLADKTLVYDDILIGINCAFLDIKGYSRDKIELGISGSREDVIIDDLMVFIDEYKTLERKLKYGE